MGRAKVRVTLTCQQCGKDFEVYPCNSGRKFCSFECSRAFLSGVNHPRWRPEELKSCGFCGVCFVVKKPWERDKKYCSYECCVADREKNGYPRTVPVGEKEVWGDGYVYVKTESGWIAEHKLVAESKIGRELFENEVVHHRNGNTIDNRPDNLLVVTRKEHMEIHALAELIGLQVMVAENYQFDVIGLGC